MSGFNYDGIDPVVLYDMFYEMGTQLGGHLVAMERSATSEPERVYWDHRHLVLNQERAGIDWRDSDTQIATMERWKAERDDLAAILDARRASQQDERAAA